MAQNRAQRYHQGILINMTTIHVLQSVIESQQAMIASSAKYSNHLAERIDKLEHTLIELQRTVARLESIIPPVN